MSELHEYRVQGLTLHTGDLLATIDGSPNPGAGQFWWIVGRLLPGVVDHIAVYVGPGPRCVEAGATGKVIEFYISLDATAGWDGDGMAAQRGFVDALYGAAYPLASHSEQEAERIRLDVAAYVLAQVGKPYNLNFLNAETEDAFYCSQLAYKAYLRHGINFNRGSAIDNLPLSRQIVYPQEVWKSCEHKRA